MVTYVIYGQNNRNYGERTTFKTQTETIKSFLNVFVILQMLIFLYILITGDIMVTGNGADTNFHLKTVYHLIDAQH